MTLATEVISVKMRDSNKCRKKENLFIDEVISGLSNTDLITKGTFIDISCFDKSLSWS